MNRADYAWEHPVVEMYYSGEKWLMVASRPWPMRLLLRKEVLVENDPSFIVCEGDVVRINATNGSAEYRVETEFPRKRELGLLLKISLWENPTLA